MQLLKQSKLFFKEGNSDKVYEVDLCQVGAEQYVVNFRYGRRGATLKEGTKTDKPVILAIAEETFNALEVEKRKKGYQTEEEMFQPLPTFDFDNNAAQTPQSAILKRLQALAEGKDNPFKTKWKTSRVIWRAGELRVKEAVSFIIRLTDRGDEMQRYAALWALGRCGDESASRTLSVYFSNQKYSEKIRRIAGESLLHTLTGDDLAKHIEIFYNRLPDDFKEIIDKANQEQLSKILQERIINQSNQPDYQLLEDLYMVAFNKPFLKKAIAQILTLIPLRPNYFKTVRHIYKLAELRDDVEVLGILACRIEQTASMFNSSKSYSYYDDEEATDSPKWIMELGEMVKVKAELKKKNSRLAFSVQTKSYFQRRAMRQLNEFGTSNDSNFIKLAVAILLQYDVKKNYSHPYTSERYEWYTVRGSYYQKIYETKFPAYSRSNLFNQILYGNSNRIVFYGNQWRIAGERLVYDNGRAKTKTVENPAVTTDNSPKAGGFLNRFFDRIFSSKQESASQVVKEVVAEEEVKETNKLSETQNNGREELFPELWDKFPQAYVQLLLQARVEEIHQFACNNLLQHPDYQSINQKIDKNVILQLLKSDFETPSKYGLSLVKERIAEGEENFWIEILLQSPHFEALRYALELMDKNPSKYLEDSNVVLLLMTSPVEDVRKWVAEKLAKNRLSEVQQQVLLGRVISYLSTISENTESNNIIIKSIAETTLKSCSDVLPALSNASIADLLQKEVEETQSFAVRIIILKNVEPSAEVLVSLLTSSFAEVRKVGKELLTELLPRLKNNQEYLNQLVAHLIPALMRKETSEGLHQDIADLLQNQLSENLQTVDLQNTIRLIHANYTPAQEVGLVILQKHTNANEMAMRQIVNFGNHEIQSIRNFTKDFYNSNIARIKFEREESIRLLDAKWDDTRAFAIDFFRDKFTSDDWSPEVLIGVVDSVRPDIQQFGRELISRFFQEDSGEEYLLKLSQHPTASVQLFATNYLERFASDSPERLEALAFYFRSVLMKVYQGRSAKGRIFDFLHQEGLKSEISANIVSVILSDVSATNTIQDKAKCISILRDLNQIYTNLKLPLQVLDFELVEN
jgi:predicted DNA-binding WGR domain protein